MFRTYGLVTASCSTNQDFKSFLLSKILLGRESYGRGPETVLKVIFYVGQSLLPQYISCYICCSCFAHHQSQTKTWSTARDPHWCSLPEKECTSFFRIAYWRMQLRFFSSIKPLGFLDHLFSTASSTFILLRSVNNSIAPLFIMISMNILKM